MHSPRQQTCFSPSPWRGSWDTKTSSLLGSIQEVFLPSELISCLLIEIQLPQVPNSVEIFLSKKNKQEVKFSCYPSPFRLFSMRTNFGRQCISIPLTFRFQAGWTSTVIPTRNSSHTRRINRASQATSSLHSTHPSLVLYINLISPNMHTFFRISSCLF
jgi:hypothetical protein